MKKSLVLGFFDGVHKAHRAVISSALDQSEDVTLITFKESPALYFGAKAEYILSRKDSLEKIKHLGVNQIVELDFANIATMPANEYIEYLIKTYNPISISTGFNHTFGVNKQGNSELLKENQEKHNYKYLCTPPIEENGEIISSTLIKNYLMAGEIEKANTLLESNFIIEGEVIHGAKIGRTIGFPTANLNYPKELVKIPFGVYKVLINLDSTTKKTGVMNWGIKPTVNNTLEPVAEVHILNYNGNLYGENIKTEVLKQIRGEQKFNNLNELKAQINEDIKKCSES